MDQKTLEEYSYKVANCLVKNAAHCFNIPFYELNLLLCELEKRNKNNEKD